MSLWHRDLSMETWFGGAIPTTFLPATLRCATPSGDPRMHRTKPERAGACAPLPDAEVSVPIEIRGIGAARAHLGGLRRRGPALPMRRPLRSPPQVAGDRPSGS